MSQKTLRAAILVMGLFTALVHLVLLNLSFVQETGSPDLLFTLNGLGYLAFLTAFFWEGVPFFSTRRRLLHYLFIAYTAVTVLAWVAMGARNAIGYVTKLDEVLLIAALVLDLRLEKKA